MKAKEKTKKNYKVHFLKKKKYRMMKPKEKTKKKL
jgi:hypothetical protein